MIDFKENKTPGLSNTAVKNLLRADQASYGNSISPTTAKNNKQTVNNSVKSEFSIGNADTVARNEAEEANRREALSMYKRMRDEQRRQDPNALTAEDIYNQTGWYYDEYGNFVVDHDAPVYAKDMTDNERARSYVEYAHKFAETAEAENAQVRSENAALREDVSKWPARAEAAEKAARIIERDAAARIASDSQLSPDYMPSKKQVKGIVA